MSIKRQAMGIQLKLFFSDSKEQLNVIVEDYDRATKKVLRTMLDVMVDLESKRNTNNISEIDELNNDDLTSQNNFSWNSNDDLERVLGEELGIEISNITGNAVPLQVTSGNEKSDSAIAAVVSMAEKCTLSDKDEEEILNTDFPDVDFSKNITNSDDTNLVRKAKERDEDMIEATLLPKDISSNITNAKKNDDAEKIRNVSVITNNRSKNEDQLISSENEDQSTPSTSRISTKKYDCERSKSREESTGSPQSDDCISVIEVLDFDSMEEVDRWSIGNISDKDHDYPKIVDLDIENVDPRSVRTRILPSTAAASCSSITLLVHDFSDDDEVYNQYSSARSSTRLKDSIETLYDVDCADEIQVVDLTADREVECVDLTSTNDKKCGPSAAQHPVVIRRSPDEVMNELRNFYMSNKEMIAVQKDALRAFTQRTDKKFGIEAPPKLSNGLPYRKRSCTVTDESDIKFSRITRSSGNEADESPRKITPLNKEVPKPTCGPPGFRVNDDFGKQTPKMAEILSHDPRCSNSVPNVYGRASRQFNFRGNRRLGRAPLSAKSDKFRPRMQSKRFFKRFGQNHISPLRRQNYAHKSSRCIHPTHFRGEVWLDLK